MANRIKGERHSAKDVSISGGVRKASRDLAQAQKAAARQARRAQRKSKSVNVDTPTHKVVISVPKSTAGLFGETEQIDRDFQTRRTVTEEITPAIARAYLKKNTNNRPLSQAHSKNFRDLILKGEWKHTHQGIAFAQNGALADGQHRLYGIVMAQKTVTMEVTYGLSNEERDALDQGRKRTAAHVAAIRQRDRGEQVKNYLTQRTAVAKQMLRGTAGGAFHKDHMNIVKWLEKYDDLISDYVEIAHTQSLRPVYHSGWVAGFAMAAVIHGRTLIDPLYERLQQLKFRDVDDPLAALFSVLNSRRVTRAADYYGYAIAAISAEILNKPRKLIRGMTADMPEAESIRLQFAKEIAE